MKVMGSTVDFRQREHRSTNSFKFEKSERVKLLKTKDNFKKNQMSVQII